MLGMFLLTCAHGAENRMIQDIFQHSGETVHRHFYSVLKVVCELVRDMIRPHPNYNDGVEFHKPCNKGYLSFFKVRVPFKISILFKIYNPFSLLFAN